MTTADEHVKDIPKFIKDLYTVHVDGDTRWVRLDAKDSGTWFHYSMDDASEELSKLFFHFAMRAAGPLCGTVGRLEKYMESIGFAK